MGSDNYRLTATTGDGHVQIVILICTPFVLNAIKPVPCLHIKGTMMKELKKDAERMLEVMERTATPCDLWQDRCVYWMAVAVYHVIMYLLRNNERR